MPAPADGHVHSEWSWDATGGSMEESCRRAAELGLPAIAFTEHVDHTVLAVSPDGLEPGQPLRELSDADGALTPPALDVVGYLDEVARCQELFPDLRILSGVELGEPHRHPEAVRRVLAAGDFDRVLGSLHALADGEVFREPAGLFDHHDPYDVVRGYLEEVVTVVTASDVFEVLAHIDYPLRSWPASAPPLRLAEVEDELRHALRVTADTGRALELNTVLPLDAAILRWWREEGGATVTFGSDAHDPAGVARGFRDATALAEAEGFRAGGEPTEPWRRAR